jgi:hypothetical protein
MCGTDLNFSHPCYEQFKIGNSKPCPVRPIPRPLRVPLCQPHEVLWLLPAAAGCWAVDHFIRVGWNIYAWQIKARHP